MAAKQTRRGRRKSPGTSSRSSPHSSRTPSRTGATPPKTGKHRSSEDEIPLSVPSAPELSPRDNDPVPPPRRFGVFDEFPAMYNETYLRLIPRDPGLLFAFWEITPDEFPEIKKAIPEYKAPSPPRLLRLYEIGGSGGGGKPRERAVADIPVEEATGSRYIPVPEPGRRYRAEYGIRAPEGRFVPLCRSKEVDVPAGKARDPIPGTAVPAAARLLFDISARASAVISAPEAERRASVLNVNDTPRAGEAPNAGRGFAGSSRFIAPPSGSSV